MTDDEFVTQLRRTMRDHDADAPTADAIRERLDAPRPVLAPSRRRWLPAVAAAAVVAIVVAAGVTWSVSRDESGSGPSGSAKQSPPTEPATRTVTVFYARGYSPGPGIKAPQWHLVPQQVTVEDSGDPGFDAVRALFERSAPDGFTNWFRYGGRAVKVNSVTASSDRVTVDVDRSLAHLYPVCLCPEAEPLLQQMAWTVSTALESQAPILLTVNGRPLHQVEGERLTGPGVPSPYTMADNHRNFAWYREACGPFAVVALTSDGRRIDATESDGPTASVDVEIGDTLRLEIRGECFRSFSVRGNNEAVLQESSPQSRTFIARKPGRAAVAAWVDPCGTYFIQIPCEGLGLDMGAIDVIVTAD